MSLPQACRSAGNKDNLRIMNWNYLQLDLWRPNVDAAFNAERQEGATGVGIQDDWLGCKCNDSVLDEAYAERNGFTLVNNL
jgi:hypothetical protein